MKVEIRRTSTGWGYFINNLCRGQFDQHMRTFFKREKTGGRFKKLKDGPGHGFPVEVLNRLANDGCTRVVIKEGKVKLIIPFEEFTNHMEYRNLKNERKVFCSLKWFTRKAG